MGRRISQVSLGSTRYASNVCAPRACGYGERGAGRYGLIPKAIESSHKSPHGKDEAGLWSQTPTRPTLFFVRGVESYAIAYSLSEWTHFSNGFVQTSGLFGGLLRGCGRERRVWTYNARLVVATDSANPPFFSSLCLLCGVAGRER